MARGRFNKILEFIGLVDEDPDAMYDQQSVGAQVYNPPGRNAPESARPMRTQSGYYGGYNAAAPKGYDRYPSPQTRNEPRAPYRSQERERASEYRAARYDAEPQVDYRASAARQQDYGRAVSAYRGESRAPQPRRSDPIRDEFERLEQPRAAAAPAPVAPRMDVRPQTVIYYLRTLEECRDVITDLIDNKTVLLNLEEMDEHTIQRGIDTLCGAAFALNATLRKASDKTYLIAPNSVEVAMTAESERRY